MFARAVAGERLSHHETSRPRRDGTRFEVSMGVSPIFAPDGSIVGASAILHEITERKRRERDLAESRALIEKARTRRTLRWLGLFGHFKWTTDLHK